MVTTHALYVDKPDSYFSGARADMVAALTTDAGAAILELGCGDGSTGALVLAQGKAGRYVGIELDTDAAKLARTRLSEVIEGDVSALDLSALHGQFDALIASEVLEHVIDPWAVMAKLVPCLNPGALVLTSSPNIAHWRVIARLIRGHFTHTETGVMDRSHLRWFTPESYAALMRSAGLEVISMAPITPHGHLVGLINALTGGRFRHLFMTQIYVVARKPS